MTLTAASSDAPYCPVNTEAQFDDIRTMSNVTGEYDPNSESKF